MLFVNNDQSKKMSNNDSNNSNKTQSNVKHKYFLGFVGTFILVYAIASGATVYSDRGQLGVIGIGVVHALVLTAIIYAIGYRSGAQVNPAVTIGLGSILHNTHINLFRGFSLIRKVEYE